MHWCPNCTEPFGTFQAWWEHVVAEGCGGDGGGAAA
jgi:hypothetical protein